MPWTDPEWIVCDLRGVYAALTALRRDQHALTGGGIRWLHAEGDALAFIRETGDSAVLVVVARASAPAHPRPPCGCCPESGSRRLRLKAGTEAGFNGELESTCAALSRS